eukprot:GHRR01012213.1.p1 GENE.GHRR01012213.1~~GHRR01012213.1.p1  ORF type:complete len:191 (+),score=37.59 GHRR01012213.1:809-1381(+)
MYRGPSPKLLSQAVGNYGSIPINKCWQLVTRPCFNMLQALTAVTSVMFQDHAATCPTACMQGLSPPLQSITKTAHTYTIISNGFSMYCLNAFIHSAPTAPSTTLWSQLNVTFITCTSANSPSSTSSTLGKAAPTARMAACGGLTIAANCLMPYMPKLLMVNVPPMNSCGCSLPCLACSKQTDAHAHCTAT